MAADDEAYNRNSAASGRVSEAGGTRAHPYLLVRRLARGAPLPSRWDLGAFTLIFGLLALAAIGAHQAVAPMASLRAEGIHLAPAWLPDYALRTTLRMLAAMVASLLFSIVYGYACAKSVRAARVLVPLLDILQSVPILGFLSFTVTFFLGLFPHRVLGAELASIFAIFTSQAWNMTFSVYQSLRTVPENLVEASRSLRLSPWQRFWRLEMPFATPGLLWNMMVSMSGGWFFVVASEAITVGSHSVALPGIGSYVALAIERRDLAAIGWAIGAMLVVILLYDQLLFRPLIAWGDRFRSDEEPGQIEHESWLLDLLQRSRLIAALRHLLDRMLRWSLRRRRLRETAPSRSPARATRQRSDARPWSALIGYGLFAGAAAYGAWVAGHLVFGTLDTADILHAVLLGFITLIRVLVLVAVASLIWVPIGVYIGLRPRLSAIAQPVAQFLAAFPANLFFPVAVAVIVRFHLDPDIWLSPLMILGTQWYILFNVIAGASSYSGELLDAAANLRLRGWLWWRRAILPGILPFYVTGAMTAAGGSWNASIVAELVSWGHTQLQAHGLGAYVARATAAGDYPRIVLGVAVMSLFVVGLNRFLWRPLYQFAERRSGAIEEDDG